MEIRSETTTDAEEIGAVNRAAFGRDAEAVLVDRLRRSADHRPALSLVAVDDDRVVGHLLLSRIGVDDGERIRRAGVLALAPMAVLPDFQGRGIGSALVRRAVRDATDRGERLIVVVGHASYYPRFGFVPARPLGILPPFDVPDEAWMAVPLAADHPRGTVRYPQAFDGL